MRIVPIVLALLAVHAFVSPTHAAWPNDPYVNVMVASAVDQQIPFDLCEDGAGGAFATWEDLRSGQIASYVTHILADGSIAPGWPANGRAMPFVANGQRAPRVVPSGGGCIVTWMDFRSSPTNPDIFAIRVTSTGALDPAWPATGRALSTAAVRDFEPKIVSDGASGAFVAWNEEFTTTDRDVRATRVLANGTLAPGFPASGLSIATNTFDQVEPAITSDGAGGALIAWTDKTQLTGSYYNVRAQRVLSNATIAWAPGGADLTFFSAGNARTPILESDGANGAWLAFSVEGTGALIGVNRVTSTSALAFGSTGPILRDLPTICRYPRLTSDGAGGIVVAWEDYRSGVGTGAIYAQRVLASGATAWASGGVATHADAGSTSRPLIVADGVGGAILTWEGALTSESANPLLRAQRLSSAGGRLWGPNGVPVCGIPGATRPMLVSDTRGGALLTWWDFRNVVFSGDVYAQRLDRFGALGDVAPAITRVADVPGDQGGAVSLQWTASPLDREVDPQVARYSLWRRVPGGTAAAARRAGATVVGIHDDADPAVTKLWREDRLGSQVVYWEFVTTKPAGALPGYSAVIATTSDSTAGSNPRTALMVRAENSAGTAWWDSAPDSGYSVDNVAPPTPSPFEGLYSGGTSILTWPASPAPDFATFRLYRGTNSTFVPGPGNLVLDSPATGASDPVGAPYWYKLVAVDVHGNASAPAVLLPRGAVGVEGGAPLAFACSAARPSPARGAVTFDVALPAPADVRVDVFDAAGRRVRSLVAANRGAGVHALRWDGRDENGAPVGAGLYFARVQAGAHRAERRVVMTK